VDGAVSSDEKTFADGVRSLPLSWLRHSNQGEHKDTVKDVCLSDDRSRIGKESLGAFTACWRPFGKPLRCGNP